MQIRNEKNIPPEGLGTLLRGLLARLEPVVDRVYSEVVPGMRSRFYPVMRELMARNRSTVSELAVAAGVSQPAMTQTIRQMVDLGFLESSPGEDRRSRHVEFSQRGREAVAELRPVWEAVARAADSLESEISVPLARALRESLAALERKGFSARISDEGDNR